MQESLDHDILIEVRTTQNIMLTEMREMKTGIAARITDLERRIEKLEKLVSTWWATIGLYLVGTGLLAALVIWHILYQK